ncbi:MAG: hypothetical protein IKC51_00565 [Myxococcaceae bacterium]|nr:hypothetical protein [Myxococcaceae bacterium]
MTPPNAPQPTPDAPHAIAIDAHPRLLARVFAVDLPAPLADLPSPDWLVAALAPDPKATGTPHPFLFDKPTDAVRQAVRALLRVGGFKPTGRSKPSPEYLARAAAEGTLASINAAVDVGNAASLHSGLPLSVLDRDRLTEPLCIRLGQTGERYAFNQSGQQIDLSGLILLADAQGPSANAVKDAQRTKTDGATRRLIVVIWGDSALAALTEATRQAAIAAFERLGARVHDVATRATGT